jgi:chromate transporter
VTKQPVSLLDIAFVFGRVASTAFGGASIPMMRREVVRREWLTEAEFLEIYSSAQISPGGIPISLSCLIGRRLAGTPGFWIGFLAQTVPGFIALMIFAIFALDPRLTVLRAALRGCAAAAVGLMLTQAIQMTLPWRRSAVHVVLIAAVALSVFFAHLPLWGTLAIFLPIALIALR